MSKPYVKYKYIECRERILAAIPTEWTRVRDIAKLVVTPETGKPIGRMSLVMQLTTLVNRGAVESKFMSDKSGIVTVYRRKP